jgi:hypothetical protein
VTRGPFATDSKNKRNAIWIETDEGHFILRRKGGPSFGDRSLDVFIGQRVRRDSLITGYTVLAERIAPAP